MGFCGGGVGQRTVVQAFFEGKKRSLGNRKTDGLTYWLFGNAIARRCPENRPLSLIVADKLVGIKVRPAFEFTYAGWPTATTRSDLDALGLNASCTGGIPRINGHMVDIHEWYTEESLVDLPKMTYEEAALARRRELRIEKKREAGRVYNLTQQLEFA